MLASSGRHSWSATQGSGPGTIVRVSPDGRDLIIDNASRSISWTNVYAELPATLFSDGTGPLHEMRLSMQNNAQVGIMTPGMHVRDIDWIDASSRLYLNGHTVVVRSPYHAFTDGDEDVVVVKDGGQLIWTPAGSVIMLR